MVTLRLIRCEAEVHFGTFEIMLLYKRILHIFYYTDIWFWIIFTLTFEYSDKANVLCRIE